MNLEAAASLATAVGTLVLAVATFASVRSGNRAARAAERSLQAGMRPLLLPSRLSDEPQKVTFMDDAHVKLDGGRAALWCTDDVVYLVMSLRNAGNGLAVLHGWEATARAQRGEVPRPAVDSFHRHTRDLYVAAADNGFWQGAFRDPDEVRAKEVRACIEAREPVTIDLLYGDLEGGQRTISRFTCLPFGDDVWFPTVARHWSLDRPDPR